LVAAKEECVVARISPVAQAVTVRSTGAAGVQRLNAIDNTALRGSRVEALSRVAALMGHGIIALAWLCVVSELRELGLKAAGLIAGAVILGA